MAHLSHCAWLVGHTGKFMLDVRRLFSLAKTRPSTRVPSGLWVVEIALNTPTRHRAIKAIQQLELPVARKENNFVVIGPYKQKQDATRVVKELSESHGVRGWVMAGN